MANDNAPWKWTLRPAFLFGPQRPAEEAAPEEEAPPVNTAGTGTAAPFIALPPAAPPCIAPTTASAPHNHHALTLVFDALPPPTLAGPLSATCKAWAEAATAGDAWRARFRPPLPRSLVARLDAGEAAAQAPTARPPWPTAWAALARANLLRGASSWAGVATSMRSWVRAAAPPPWTVSAHGGHGWAVEFPEPEGAPPPPRPPLPPVSAPPGARPQPYGAIASSFAWCEVVQEVDLVGALVRGRGWSQGEAEAWLDAGPFLELEVWVGGREDCPPAPALAVAGLVLLDGEEVLPPYGRAIDWAGRGVAAWASQERIAPPGAWARLVGRVAAPARSRAHPARPGARRALVYLRGRDTAFWAGHFGPKFAAPSLRFLPGGAGDGLTEEEGRGMEAALPVFAPPAVVRASAAVLASAATAAGAGLPPPALALGALVGAAYAGVDALAARTAFAAPPAPLKVLITGGSRGLGRALAREFAALGDAVVITSRSLTAAQAAAGEVEESAGSGGGRVTGLRCEVSDPASVAATLRAAASTLGGLDVLINNAAARPPGGPRPLADTAPGDLAATLATNLVGPALCCAAGVAVMRHQSPPGGHIFNVDGAGAGGRASPGFAAYAGAKAGVASLTRSLAAELAAEAVPVGVHTLSPGMVLTPLLLDGAPSAVRATGFNWFAEQPEAAAAFLVPRVRSVVAAGGPRSTAIRVLTPLSAAAKFAASLLRVGRRPHFDRAGVALYAASERDRLASSAGRAAAARLGQRKGGLAAAYALSMAAGVVAVVGGWW